MKFTLKHIFIALTMCFAITAAAQLPQSSPLEISSEQACEMLLVKKLDFMVDGSFASERVLVKEIAKLKPCGLNDYDVTFFSNMDIFSMMLTRISKEKEVEQMNYNDVYTEIIKFKKSEVFQEIKSVTIASEQLGQTTGNIRNWEQDVALFKELGASEDVIERVYNYLKSRPENTKTYQEILELLKKG